MDGSAHDSIDALQFGNESNQTECNQVSVKSIINGNKNTRIIFISSSVHVDLEEHKTIEKMKKKTMKG